MSLTSYLNSACNEATGKSPNEINFGFDLNSDTLVGLRTLDESDFEEVRMDNKQQAEESMAFAAAQMKWRYDEKHLRVVFDRGDWVWRNEVDSQRAYLIFEAGGRGPFDATSASAFHLIFNRF